MARRARKKTRKPPYARERRNIERDVLEKRAFDSGEPMRQERVHFGGQDPERMLAVVRSELRFRLSHLGSVWAGPKGRRHRRKRDLRANYTFIGYMAGSLDGRKIETKDTTPRADNRHQILHAISSKSEGIYDASDIDYFIDQIRATIDAGYTIENVNWVFG